MTKIDIRFPDRGKPVRNDKTRASLHQSSQTPSGSLISVRVSMDDVASSKISIGGRQSITLRDTQKLLLPLGKIATILGDQSVIALRQTLE